MNDEIVGIHIKRSLESLSEAKTILSLSPNVIQIDKACVLIEEAIARINRLDAQEIVRLSAEIRKVKEELNKLDI